MDNWEQVLWIWMVWGSKNPLWCGQETINYILIGEFLVHPKTYETSHKHEKSHLATPMGDGS